MWLCLTQSVLRLKTVRWHSFQNFRGADLQTGVMRREGGDLFCGVSFPCRNQAVDGHQSTCRAGGRKTGISCGLFVRRQVDCSGRAAGRSAVAAQPVQSDTACRVCSRNCGSHSFCGGYLEGKAAGGCTQLGSVWFAGTG